MKYNYKLRQFDGETDESFEKRVVRHDRKVSATRKDRKIRAARKAKNARRYWN